jgi:hypothetical protein
LFSIAQKKSLSFYSIFKGGIFKLDGIDASPAGSIQFGVSIKNGLSLGIGGSYTKFKDDDNAYIPLFAELSYIRYNRKLAPYFNVQFGKGIYDVTKKHIGNLYEPDNLNIEGSYFWSFGTGLIIPVARNKSLLITGQYLLTKFNNTKYGSILTQNGFVLVNDKTTTTRNGFLLAVGFNINLHN